MIKGCQKKIIMINDTGSDIFEQAYFIIKDETKSEKIGKTDMIREASRIIDENLLGAYFGKEKKIRKRKKACDTLMFSLGALCGSGIIGILWMIAASC